MGVQQPDFDNVAEQVEDAPEASPPRNLARNDNEPSGKLLLKGRLEGLEEDQFLLNVLPQALDAVADSLDLLLNYNQVVVGG